MAGRKEDTLEHLHAAPPQLHPASRSVHCGHWEDGGPDGGSLLKDLQILHRRARSCFPALNGNTQEETGKMLMGGGAGTGASAAPEGSAPFAGSVGEDDPWKCLFPKLWDLSTLSRK